MFPDTEARVPRHTARRTNAVLEQGLAERLIEYAHHPERVDARLRELDREWDIERTLEANAAAFSLLGLTLATTVDRRWLGLPVAVAGFLMQHATQGWCPPLAFFRRRGVRTAGEIAEERYALKALRGDFDGLARTANDPPAARAQAALRSVEA